MFFANTTPKRKINYSVFNSAARKLLLFILTRLITTLEASYTKKQKPNAVANICLSRVLEGEAAD